MPLFTGNDTNGVVVGGNNQKWYTLAGNVVSNNGDAFSFGGALYSTYTIMGTVLADNDGIVSSDLSNSNHVTIASTGYVYGDSDGIELRGRYHRVVNNGEIHGDGDSGIQFYHIDGVTNGAIVNNGTVFGQSAGVYMAGGDSLMNTGLVSSGAYGVRVSGAVTIVTNFGEIVGDIGGIHLFNNGSGASEIINHGIISTGGNPDTNHAIYVGGNTRADVINHGEINGDVDLGGGDDVFDAAGGTLNGALDGHGGDDTLIMRQSNPGALMTFEGGFDSDTLDLSHFGSAVWVGLDYAGVEAWTRDDMTLTGNNWRTIADLNGVENIIGTIGIDYMAGNDADNLLGYVGSKVINGIDRMFGGDGQDTVDFSRFDSGVWINLSATGPTAWTQDDANAADAPTAENPGARSHS